MATITGAKKRIFLDEEEKEIIKSALQLLCKLRNDLDCEDIHNIVSFETGGCIEESDWETFLYILEDFVYSPFWDEE